MIITTKDDLLAQAAQFSVAPWGANGDEREFHLAIANVYRMLAEIAAAPETTRVLEPVG